MNRGVEALVHSGLFIATFITTTLAGAGWVNGIYIIGSDWTYDSAFTWDVFASGLPYSIAFLSIITVHEFGHYFYARYYKLDPTLPFYLPMPLMLGTLGAVIKIRRRIESRTQNFDVGIAGPIAGFVIALALLFYGFLTLPEADHIYTFHPEFAQYENYEEGVYTTQLANGIPLLKIGNNLLFWLFENFVGDPAKVPNHYELYHYPVIFAGFLGLLLTGLNLLPIGQLDGGHILYGLVGYKRHSIIASIVFCIFLFYTTLGMVRPGEQLDVFGYFKMPHMASVVFMIALLYFCLKALRKPPVTRVMIALGIYTSGYVVNLIWPHAIGYSGWLLFALLLGRMMPVVHPVSMIEEPLTTGRKILGWLAIVVFILCWSPRPIEMII